MLAGVKVDANAIYASRSHFKIRSKEKAKLNNDSAKGTHLFSCLIFEPKRSRRDNTQNRNISAGRDVIVELSDILHSETQCTALINLFALIEVELGAQAFR